VLPQKTRTLFEMEEINISTREVKLSREIVLG
jgi:hypothetical protein